MTYEEHLAAKFHYPPSSGHRAVLCGVPVTYSAPAMLTPHAGPDRCVYPLDLAGWHFWQDLARAVRRAHDSAGGAMRGSGDSRDMDGAT